LPDRQILIVADQVNNVPVNLTQRRRFLAKTALFAVALGITLFFVSLPGFIDRQMNAVHQAAPYSVDKPTAELHRQLLIADLHAESTLAA
jgi:hypothetical protein